LLLRRLLPSPPPLLRQAGIWKANIVDAIIIHKLTVERDAARQARMDLARDANADAGAPGGVHTMAVKLIESMAMDSAGDDAVDTAVADGHLCHGARET
jgi:hypothetical protein